MSDINISKSVDVATVELMYMALEHRSAKDGGAGPEPLTVDFAFLAPAKSPKGQTIEMKAYLKIRLGKALIKTWSLDGSSESGERATESLSLWYNQVAIAYRSTPDGLTFTVHGPRGWDQGAQKDWPASDLKNF